ncbi:BAHD acyltransferase [Prunus yedoensis var. nudiflora]|uniref:BAHD acyltransferase n=1 Tax=Prunus yedoensis var. nudiflora TaxID=2094558 RepID=A0A314UXL9_PRUYE|nr:BAHD acyltransferase [Prunus yedoensis var. nudiflora]
MAEESGIELNSMELVSRLRKGWLNLMKTIPRDCKGTMCLKLYEDNGVDALVSLSEEDMALFEHEPELLAFAYLNPCVFGPVTRRSSL